MTDPVILVEKIDRVATVTLNRPDVMNALSSELRIAIEDTFEDLKNDRSIGVVILTGAGRAFCAGLDLKELSAGKGMIGDVASKRESKVNLATPLKRFGRPIIGAINGVAVTGGFELALACDILIASTEARFADTHARVGILPGSELSQKLSRLIGIYRAKEVSLTGNFIGAQQAVEWGLVNRVVPPDQVLPACRALANDILSCPDDMVEKYKKLIDDGFHMTFGEGLELELKANIEHFKSLSPETVATRRQDVLARGRKQQQP
ncbi:MAG: enoyl-CoA hydratase [Desulfobacterales bacterium]